MSEFRRFKALLSRAIMHVVNKWKIILGLYLGINLVSGIIFSVVEKGRSIGDGIWWAFITSLSVGYGDVFPTTTTGRVTGVILGHVVIYGFAPLIIAMLISRVIADHNEFSHAEQELIKQDLAAANEKIGRLLDMMEQNHEETTQKFDALQELLVETNRRPGHMGIG